MNGPTDGWNTQVFAVLLSSRDIPNINFHDTRITTRTTQVDHLGD